MKSLNKKTAYIIIGLVISISLVVVLLRIVNIGQVWSNIQKLSLKTISIVLCIYLFSMFVRTFRWRYLISQKHDISLKVTFKALIYGYMLNQLLPAKIGEVARAEYLARSKKCSRTFLLGTIAIERVFDLIVIVTFLGISVLFSDLIMKHVRTRVFPIVLILVSLVTIFVALYHITEFKRLTKLFPLKMESTLNRLIDNLNKSSLIFHSIKQFSWLLVMSLLMWSSTCAIIYLILSNLSITLPFYAYLFIVSAGTFGMIIPSTSANIGVYHAVAMGSVMLFNVSKENALSFAIVAHAFDFFPSIILGGILFGYNGIKHLKNNRISV